MKTLKCDRDSFMAFFRDTDQLNTLTADERVEIFRTILTGSSDITHELLQSILDDYDVRNIEIVTVIVPK